MTKLTHPVHNLILTLTCLLAIGCNRSNADTTVAGSPAEPADAIAEAASPPPLPDEIRGLWVWHDIAVSTYDEQDRLLDFCQRHGFNLLLVQIHDIKEAPTYTIKYPRELTRLVGEATQRGITVEALDGAKDMAVAANQTRTLAILDAIIDLNQSMPQGARFAGIHYDIEPYLMDGWKQDQASRDVIMRDLLDYYSLAREKLRERGSEMHLACDIPMWYDLKTEPGDSCVIEYNGQTKNLHQHIQDICDYIGIMSYRTHAVGSNSVTEHVEDELAYAESIGKKICAALEVSKLENTPQITFYGWSPEAFLEQYNLVRTTLHDRPGYGGVLIQSVRALRNLLENEPLPQ